MKVIIDIEYKPSSKDYDYNLTANVPEFLYMDAVSVYDSFDSLLSALKELHEEYVLPF